MDRGFWTPLGKRSKRQATVKGRWQSERYVDCLALIKPRKRSDKKLEEREWWWWRGRGSWHWRVERDREGGYESIHSGGFIYRLGRDKGRSSRFF